MSADPAPAPRRTAAHLVRWAPVAACAAILVWHSLQYDFVTDDAYISFVFSRNLAEHGQLVFNLGAPIEGYTNFLWTFVLGLLMVIGVPPELSSRVLGTACGVGVLVVAFRLVERLRGGARPTTWRELSGWPVVAPLLLAWSSGFACWSSGGLETQLFTLLVTLALEAYVASVDGEPMRLVRAGTYLALAAMTRPEGLLIAGLLGVHRAAWRLPRVVDALRAARAEATSRGRAVWRAVVPDAAELRCVAAFLVIWAPWFAWRWWYYGWPFPNTYYVKATGDLAIPVIAGRTGAQQIWHNGFYYLWRWVQQTHLLWISPAVALGLVAAPWRSARLQFGTLALLVGGAYLYYAASVGGDFMGLHRFIMPVFVLVAVGAALGLGWIADALAARRVPRAAPAAVAGLVVAAFAWSQWQLTNESLRWGNFANDNGIDTPAFLIVYTEDRATIGRAMAPCFHPDDFSIVGGAGAQPYYGRMRAIDVFGLVSDKIAHGEPRTNARAGHDKWASDQTLATYDPTFVFSCYDLQHVDPKTGACPTRSFVDGCGGFWLARGYEQVTMKIDGLRERGECYTFLAKKARRFECPGRVR